MWLNILLSKDRKPFPKRKKHQKSKTNSKVNVRDYKDHKFNKGWKNYFDQKSYKTLTNFVYTIFFLFMIEKTGEKYTTRSSEKNWK